MNIRVVTPADLTADHVAAWLQIQTSDPRLHGPFFHPSFTQAVAAVRNDVEVAVLEEAGEPVGFFPYQRDHRDVGVPVGGYMSDFQAVISRPGLTFSPADLIRGCGLRAWRFDHLLGSQDCFQPYHWLTAASPYLDVSGGFDAYCGRRSHPRSNELKEVSRKIRKAERSPDAVRYEPDCAPEVLDRLIDWKVQQYRRMQVINYFQPQWTRALLARLLAQRDDAFRGMLCALYLDGRLAAARFSVRASGVLHALIMAYDVELSKHSPGSMLLVKTVMAAQDLGITRIDLGKGTERYKQQFKTGETTVAEGAVDLRLTAAIRKGWRCTRELVRASPLGVPAQRMIRSARGWLIYR